MRDFLIAVAVVVTVKAVAHVAITAIARKCVNDHMRKAS